MVKKEGEGSQRQPRKMPKAIKAELERFKLNRQTCLTLLNLNSLDNPLLGAREIEHVANMMARAAETMRNAAAAAKRISDWAMADIYQAHINLTADEIKSKKFLLVPGYVFDDYKFKNLDVAMAGKDVSLVSPAGRKTTLKMTQAHGERNLLLSGTFHGEEFKLTEIVSASDAPFMQMSVDQTCFLCNKDQLTACSIEQLDQDTNYVWSEDGFIRFPLRCHVFEV